MSAPGRFVGVGVGDYRDPAHESREFAVEEVRELHRLLGGSMGDEPLANPTKAQVQSVVESLPSGSEAATAALCLTVAATLAGGAEQVGQALAPAREWDPAARDSWISEIAAIGGTHSRALSLITAQPTPIAGTDRGPDPTTTILRERP